MITQLIQIFVLLKKLLISLLRRYLLCGCAGISSILKVQAILLSDFHLPADTKEEKAVLVYEESVATRDFSPAIGRLADSFSVSIWTYGIDNIDYAPDNMPAIESIVTSRLH